VRFFIRGFPLSFTLRLTPSLYDFSCRHYCDGSSYSSFRAEPIAAPVDLQSSLDAIAATQGEDWAAYQGVPAGSAPPQIWMRGRACLRAVVEYLLQNMGMASGTELVVSGGSAGATGVYLGLDYIREWVPQTLRVAGAPDAGFFLDLPRLNSNNTWYRDCFQAASGVWNGTDISSPSCISANPTEIWKCYLAEYNTLYISTPLFVSNSAIDMWGLGNILALPCIPFMDNKTRGGQRACDPDAWNDLQGWWDAFQARINPWLSASPSSRSAFIPSCYVHEINVDYCSGQSLPNCRGWKKYLVSPSAGTPGTGPITLQEATTQWFQALFRSGNNSYQMSLREGMRAVEDHVRGRRAGGGFGATPVSQWVDATRYPMNPSCYYPPGRL